MSLKSASARPEPGLPHIARKDVAVTSPNSIEFVVNSDFSASQEVDRVYFATHRGDTKKVMAVLDSLGDPCIVGKL